jgi:hypothetical protein
MPDYALYLDDGGHPNDQPYVIVAGFLSSEQGWLAFETEWNQALKKHGIVPVFHMTDFHGKRTKAEEGRVMDDLTGIIIKNVNFGFSVSVSMRDYRKVNDLYALEEAIGTPFALASRTVASGVNRWKSEFLKPGEHLLVFVEEGTKHMGDMEEAFRRDELPIPQRVPKSHPAVQPADLLAWETFHFSKSEYRERRRSLVNLAGGIPWYEGTMREKNLMHSVRTANIPLRSSIAANTLFSYHSSPKRSRKRTIK